MYDDDIDDDESLDISGESSFEHEAQNPADNDFLDDDTTDEDTPFETESSKEMSNADMLNSTEESIKGGRKKNEAPFLARQLIGLVILGGIIVIIVFSVFIIPLFDTDKTEVDILDKRGVVYIPNQIENWSPEETVEKFSDAFPDQEEEPYDFKTDDELLAELSFSDEALGVAPIPVSGTTAPGTNVASPRPETNRNAQQKMIGRMPMSDNGLNLSSSSQGGGFSQGGTGLPSASQAYAQKASSQMNNLLSSLSGAASSNTYDSQNNQSNKQSFNGANSGALGMQMNSEYSLYVGTIIPAALVTKINTDLPGVVIARVTSNVYSSLDGKHLLIPVGTRLFATYNSSISYGQSRVQVAWNKMIRPDGIEIDLGNMVGVDNQGSSGYRGFVNDHPFEYAKAIGLIAMFSLVDTKVENLVTAQDNLYAQNIIADTYSNINKLSGEIINRALDLQPTITVAQGTQINIITNITMDLPPVENFDVTQLYVRQ